MHETHEFNPILIKVAQRLSGINDLHNRFDILKSEQLGTENVDQHSVSLDGGDLGKFRGFFFFSKQIAKLSFNLIIIII